MYTHNYTNIHFSKQQFVFTTLCTRHFVTTLYTNIHFSKQQFVFTTLCTTFQFTSFGRFRASFQIAGHNLYFGHQENKSGHSFCHFGFISVPPFVTSVRFPLPGGFYGEYNICTNLNLIGQMFCPEANTSVRMTLRGQISSKLCPKCVSAPPTGELKYALFYALYHPLLIAPNIQTFCNLFPF